MIGAMRGLRMSVWMAGLNVGLVLLVAAGLAPGGLLLLRRLATNSARAQVQLAAIGALEGLRLQGEEVMTGAKLLAERPTLHRLVDSGEKGELEVFLGQFSRTSQLDGCAVFGSSGLVAAWPSDAPWADINRDPAEGVRYGRILEPDPVSVLVASAPLRGAAEGETVAFRRIDARVTRQLRNQVGLPVEVLADTDKRRDSTLEVDGTWQALRFLNDEAHHSRVGLRVELPASEVRALSRPVERTFVLVTGAAVLLAVAAALAASKHFSRPLTQLQAAATNIGSGDLATPVAPVSGVEARALATTMEGMRRRLQAATAELHQREAEARTLLEGMTEGVFAVDGDRRIQSLNAQAAQRIGSSPEAVIGRFCGDVLRPMPQGGQRPCEDSCPIVHARSRGSSRAVEHLELPGGRRTMVITSAPPAGSHQVQLMRDETETEAARRSRDAVLANVSHELKTPLAAQTASIQLLQDALGDDLPEPAVELVASLERSTLRLNRLIDNLLESVRIETGRTSFRRVELDLAGVVTEAEAMVSPLLRQRGQDVQIELPPALPPVLGDPVQLTQVFVNLLANANKFSPEGSLIRIGGHAEDGLASIWVEDRGPGIPAAERRSVFEHYYRSDPGAAEGIGLGLWIVKSIVERHQGIVKATAASEGGARFIVSLPAVGSR